MPRTRPPRRAIAGFNMSEILPPNQTYRPLYELTIEQLLLTHVALREAGLSKADAFREAYGGARARDQVKNCDDAFKHAGIVDGLYVTEHGKVLQTPAGVAFAGSFPAFREAVDTFFTSVHERGTKVVRVAATEFTMGLVCQAYSRWHTRLSGATIDLIPMRTNDLAMAIKAGRADIGFGACVADEKSRPINLSPELQFHSLGATGEMGILTNASDVNGREKLATEEEVLDFLREKTLLLPRPGLVLDYVNSVVSRFNSPPKTFTITDVYFALSILENEIKTEACMFLLKGLYQRLRMVLDGGGKGDKIKFIDIPQSIFSHKLLIGMFRRKTAERFPASHPFNVIWSVKDGKG
jgi:hypothetical protein